MDTVQKRTFLVYSRGLSADDMSLGSLYLDPANPLDIERKRLECPKGNEIQGFLRRPQYDEHCELHFSASSDWLISAGVMDILHIKTGRTGARDVSISAKSSLRCQIKSPEAFLNDVVLTAPGAKAWLADKLSLSRFRYFKRKVTSLTSQYSGIWMLTGVQFLIHAEVKSGNFNSSTDGGGAAVPPPEPVAAAVSMLTGTLLANFDVEFNRAADTKISYNYKDARVWAAEFAPLDVKYSPAAAFDESSLPTRILLGPFPDLGNSGVRHNESQTTKQGLPEAEIADIIGLDNAKAQEWDEDPSLLMKAIQEVDWNTLLDNELCSDGDNDEHRLV